MLSQYLLSCFILVGHTLADPAVSKFMGKAFMPAAPAARPMRPAATKLGIQPLGKDTVMSSGAEAQVAVGNQDPFVNIERWAARLEGENFVLNSELQQLRSQIEQVEMRKQEQQSTAAATVHNWIMWAVLAGTAVSAIFYYMISKLRVRSGDVTAMECSPRDAAELRLFGGAALEDRSSVPMMKAGGAEAASEKTRMTGAPMMNADTLPSIPGLPRPKYLDGTLAGDFGFDPLSLASSLSEGVKVGPFTLGPNTRDTNRSLIWMREAEVKHARLAMLAAAGWPLEELWNPIISKISGMPDMLETTQGRSVSVLNGGLDEVLPFLLAITLGTIVIEVSTLDRVNGLTALGKTMKPSGEVVMKTYVPGDCEFDPLQLYDLIGTNIESTFDKMFVDDDPMVGFERMQRSRKEMEAGEIANGRLAMLAITGFAVQELVLGKPVVDQTPIFFTFFGEFLAPGSLTSIVDNFMYRNL